MIKQLCRKLPLLLLALIGYSSYGQISVGAKAGANFSSLGEFTFYNTDRSALKFNVGAFGRYEVLPFLNARAEIIYSQEGGPLKDYYFDYPYVKRSDVHLTSHSLQIPVMAELGLPSMKESKISPKLLLGGYYSYAFQYRESYDKTIKIPGYPASESQAALNVSSSYNRSNFGYIVGVGANTTLAGKALSIDFRYSRCIDNINSNVSIVPDQLRDAADKNNKVYMGTFSLNAALTLFNF